MRTALDKLERSLVSTKRSNRGGRLKPHKLLMLLAVLDLLDAGALKENRIPYNPGLAERFGEYLHAVAGKEDWCQAAPPFFHLRSESFWMHVPVPGREAEYAALKTPGGGSKRITENIAYAYLDDDALAAASDPGQRQGLRDLILQSFFSPEDQETLRRVVTREAGISEYEALLEASPGYGACAAIVPLRAAACAQVVRRVYDYQCAMCRLRVIAPDGSIPVDAAHLIPGRDPHDDSPTNGVALYKLQHRALDARLVAPPPPSEVGRLTWVGPAPQLSVS